MTSLNLGGLFKKNNRSFETPFIMKRAETGFRFSIFLFQASSSEYFVRQFFCSLSPFYSIWSLKGLSNSEHVA